MDVTKPCKFIGFGAMDVTKPYKCIGLGAMDVTKLYKIHSLEYKPVKCTHGGADRGSVPLRAL